MGSQFFNLFQSFQTKLGYQVFTSADQKHYWKQTLFSLCKTPSVLPWVTPSSYGSLWDISCFAIFIYP